MSIPASLKDDILNHFMRGEFVNSPAPGSHLALYAGDPLNGGTELAGNGYARQPITFGAPEAGSGGRRITNTAEITYTADGGNWTQATHYAVKTALTGGVIRAARTLTNPVTLQDGDTRRFAPGSIVVVHETIT